MELGLLSIDHDNLSLSPEHQQELLLDLFHGRKPLTGRTGCEQSLVGGQHPAFDPFELQHLSDVTDGQEGQAVIEPCCWASCIFKMAS